MPWRLLDLFSGIGGFALAAKWAFGDELEIISFVEIDPYCQKVLRKNFPEAPIHDDIRTFSAKELVGKVDIVCGGFPCQPTSYAGKRRGQADDRWLWPEMRRIVEECRPRWVVAENVAGLITLGLDDVLSDLEDLGYEAWPVVVPACAVGAPHRRDRVWIIAYDVANTNDSRWNTQSLFSSKRGERENHSYIEQSGEHDFVADASGMECETGAEEQRALRGVPADGEKRRNAGGSGEALSRLLADTQSTGRLRPVQPENHGENLRPGRRLDPRKKGEGGSDKGPLANANGAGPQALRPQQQTAGAFKPERLLADADSQNDERRQSERSRSGEVPRASGGGSSFANPELLPAWAGGELPMPWPVTLWVEVDGKAREVERVFRGVADGLPPGLDGCGLEEFRPVRHRRQRLTALGNAIVPQVAYEIFLVMKRVDPQGS